MGIKPFELREAEQFPIKAVNGSYCELWCAHFDSVLGVEISASIRTD
jgi:hypothetical protein